MRTSRPESAGAVSGRTRPPRRARALVLVALALTLAAPPSGAGEQPIALRDGAGRELVQGICTSCHSLDYVLINSPFLTLEQWRASVTKMRTTFGAPLSAEDAETIAKYLASSYGRPAG